MPMDCASFRAQPYGIYKKRTSGRKHYAARTLARGRAADVLCVLHNTRRSGATHRYVSCAEELRATHTATPGCIPAASRLHLGCISADLGCISAASLSPRVR